MAKIIDRFLLMLFSLVTLVMLVTFLLCGFGVIPLGRATEFISDIYMDTNTAAMFIAICCLVLIVAGRMFYISVRSASPNVPSIDQRTEYGDVRISLETIENLALKSAARSRGVRDLKARIQVDNAGLNIELRCIVDGETSIPTFSEEIQSNVKAHIEEITGIPVAQVSVYVANVTHNAHTFKSRVE
ncbi:MAG: alkaline shock response membrane anchor protein AmaP [Gorillibacterium sp.]|nr:alkaline shock response membrane anchor protein AmaP [Gorillibacterium sp.]